MRVLIIKRGASGDVIRTTVLRHFLRCEIDWLTSDMNEQLIRGIEGVRPVSWSNREEIFGTEYSLAINLEDDTESAAILESVKCRDRYGAYRSADGEMTYTESASPWFDLGMISRYGIQKANELKLQNRQTFQHLVCLGLGFAFEDEKYHLPEAPASSLAGDVAISMEAGKVWPMKNWAFYDRLMERLISDGYRVNSLPLRSTMLEHMADIRNHRLLISGDSLPMHFALGSGIHCITLFICTSPWEIHGYRIQEKMVSPYLERFFYRRDFDPEAPRSISFDAVYECARKMLEEQ